MKRPTSRRSVRGAADRSVLIGPRVTLRPPTHADREEWLELRRHSRAFLERWEPMPPPGCDWAGSDSFDRLLASAWGDDRRRFLITRTEDQALLGQISVNGIQRGPLQSATLGYWIGQPHARKGYLRDAMRLVLAYVFGPLGLHRVEANIQPHNEPSRRLAQSCGFLLEGFSPGYLEIFGMWADHERWAITRERFLALQDPRAD